MLECLICSTFYNVLGQGLGGEPDHLGGSGGHSPIMVRFRCFLSCVAVAAAFGPAGTIVCKADEADSWPDSDYGRVFRGFVTLIQTAGMGNLYLRTCSRTTRVTALRMGGTFHALGRANSCCARVQRVAGACFAIFIKQTFPL